MLHAKSVKTPLATHFRLLIDLSPQTDKEEKYMYSVSYVSAVESIMCIMVCTRSDVSHVLSAVSRYRLGKGYWQAVKWTL